MKGDMLTFAPLCLLLCWMLPVDSFKITLVSHLPEEDPGIPMNMAEDAVDDMYFGCKEMMTKKIEDLYFENENTGTFLNVWRNAQQCAEEKLEQKLKEDEALTKNHMQAICVYTSEYLSFYRTFNMENMHSTSFPYHYLHFWLTDAVQILNNNKNCHTTYRRTRAEFNGNVNQVIRFGSFTSSSQSTTLTGFGEKTCFKIKTCSGAFLKHYSFFGNSEQEVLIPPYEKFMITEKMWGRFVKGMEDCEVVYVLESAGVQSNLNCNAMRDMVPL